MNKIRFGKVFSFASILTMTFGAVGCNDNIDGISSIPSNLISFNIDTDDPWNVQQTRSESSDTLFHSIEAIPNSDYLLETVTLRSFNDEVSSNSSPATRGVMISDNNFDKIAGEFSLFSTVTDNSNFNAVTGLYIDNEKMVYTPYKTENGRHIWQTSSKYYWPSGKYTTRFYAISPYISDVRSAQGLDLLSADNNNSNKINAHISKDFTGTSSDLIFYYDYLPDNADDHKDILVACGRKTSNDDAESDFEGNYHKDVHLKFKHLMAAVQVKAVGPTGGCHISKVTFNNVKKNAAYRLDAILNNEMWMNYPIQEEETGRCYKSFEGNEVSASESVKTDVVNEDATFLMIPQFLDDVTLKIELTETDGADDIGSSKPSVPSFKVGGHDMSWQPGTTTIYTLIPKTVTLRMVDQYEKELYSESKTTYSMLKSFFLPDKEIENVSRDNSEFDTDKDQYCKLLGWVPYKYEREFETDETNLEKTLTSLEGFVYPDNYVNLSENTTYYPLIMFSKHCGGELRFYTEDGEVRSYNYRTYQGFVNGFEFNMTLSSHNKFFMNKFRVGDTIYDIDYSNELNGRAKFTIHHIWEIGYLIINEDNLPFIVNYEVPDEVKEKYGEMPDEKKANNSIIVKTVFDQIKISDWRENDIKWEYTDKSGKIGYVKPKEMLNVRSFHTDKVTLKAVLTSIP